MENKSITSSIHKPIASKETSQESGWTCYFEDLSNNNKTCSPSLSCGSSLISDAATTARKVSHDDRRAHASPKPPNKLRFKETNPEDDSLEDTASSPVNSPKVKEIKKVQKTIPRIRLKKKKKKKKKKKGNDMGMKNNKGVFS